MNNNNIPATKGSDYTSVSTPFHLRTTSKPHVMQQQDTTTRRMILKFPDMTTLWSFTDTLSTDFLEINARMKSIISTCSDEDLQRAISAYGASIYNEEEQ